MPRYHVDRPDGGGRDEAGVVLADAAAARKAAARLARDAAAECPLVRGERSPGVRDAAGRAIYGVRVELHEDWPG